MRVWILLILLLFFSVRSGAQYFQTGEDPASINWRQLNTEHFQLIYPDYYESQAQNLAAVLENVYGFGGYTLDHHPGKIAVVLHTQTVQSNGLVGWAPKRAEFYTTPYQAIYPQDWLEQLALHEFRHVVQIDKINKNIPGILKYLFGEQITPLIYGLHFPWWFIEGDAVVAETALSNYGRGRLPEFLMEHQAQVVEKGVFLYDKAYLGSYHDFVPNRYKLGYYLVGSSRIRYGADLWEKAMTRAGRQPITLRAINRVMKPQTGLTKVSLYYSVFDSLQKIWKAQDQLYDPIPHKIIAQPNKVYTSYLYSYWLNDSSVIAYKTSFDDIPQFVLINPSGDEKKIVRPGYVFDESINYRDSLIIWSEQISDPRWAHSGRSLLRIYDIQNKNFTEIQPEFKAFAPSISPDKKQVVVSEADFSNNYFLSFYSLSNGGLIKRIQTDNNHYFFSPEWLNENEITTIILTSEGKKLVKVDIETEEVILLLEENLGNISQIEVSDNQIYFVGTYTAKNSLYRITSEGNDLEYLYEPRFGAEMLAVSGDGHEILLSDYTANGYRLVKIENPNGKPFNEVQKGKYPIADALALQEPGIPDFTDTKKVKYPSWEYIKAAHLFNFHSWAPVSIDANDYEIEPGISFLSQNVLGTSETTLGYRWDVSEQTGQYYLNYSYRGWYPVIDMELSTGKRASEYTLINVIRDHRGEIIDRDTMQQRFTWGETLLNTNINIPLNLSKGPWIRFLQPKAGYRFNSYKHDNTTPHTFYSENLHSFSYSLYFQQLKRKSYQDIYPDAGLILDGSFRHNPIGSERRGSITALQSIVYLPGILKNHGIRLYAGTHRKSDDGVKVFSDAMKTPRGWGPTNTYKMYSYSLDYRMPLLYPDLYIPRLLYLKRIVTSVFADYAELYGNIYSGGEKTGTYIKGISSFGGEILFDANLLRFYAPEKIGIRASYLPELNRWNYDFIFSVSFDSF